MALVRAAAEMANDDDQEIGFQAAVLTQTNLPYRDPGPVPEWSRRNGKVHLLVEPGKRLNPDDTYTPIYPYGSLSRLLLIWMSTTAVKTQCATLELGESLADFLRQLGLQSTGGKRGTITRLRDQLERLLKARITIEVQDGPDRDLAGQMSIALSWNLFWSNRERDAGQAILLPSTIQLSTDFFNEIVKRPVPVHMRAIEALRGSSMRLDLYIWLTYRMSYLSRPTTITWAQLAAQFGSGLDQTTPQGRHQFRRDFATHLREVVTVYPDANAEIAETGLRLRPSLTHVPFVGLAGLGQRQPKPAASAAAGAATT